jgi:hypothetical protein
MSTLKKVLKRTVVKHGIKIVKKRLVPLIVNEIRRRKGKK